MDTTSSNAFILSSLSIVLYCAICSSTYTDTEILIGRKMVVKMVVMLRDGAVKLNNSSGSWDLKCYNMFINKNRSLFFVWRTNSIFSFQGYRKAETRFPRTFSPSKLKYRKILSYDKDDSQKSIDKDLWAFVFLIKIPFHFIKIKVSEVKPSVWQKC